MANVMYNRTLRQEGSGAFTISRIAEFTWPAGIDLRHFMTEAQVFYCLRGEGSFLVEGEWHDFHANTLFWNHPNTERGLTCSQETVALMFGIEETDKEQHQKSPLHPFLGTTPGGSARVYHPTELETMWRNILTMAHQRTVAEQSEISLLCRGLLAVAAKSLVPFTDKRTKQEDTFTQIKNFFDLHFLDIKNISDVADNFHLSQEYITRIFQGHLGISPHAYLTDLRMRLATHRLTTSDYSIKQIAYELGFTTSSAFSKAFRRTIGTSPAGYRNQNGHQP